MRRAFAAVECRRRSAFSRSPWPARRGAAAACRSAARVFRTEAPAIPEEVDFYIRMTDYKKTGGVMVPHKLTFLTENEVSEEFEISKYQLNPQFKADRFEKH